MAATETKARPAKQGGPRGLAMKMDGELAMLLVLTAMMFFMVCFIVWLLWASSTYKDPEYSIAIAAVSGLETATDRPVLDPEFNLTVRVARRSPLLPLCDESRTAVQVSYRGFTLACASAPQVCDVRDDAGEGRTVVRTVVARGTRVWLPGPTMDCLAADLRRGAGVFDVTFTMPRYSKRYRDDDDGRVVSCVGRPVGEDGGGALCDVGGLYL